MPLNDAHFGRSFYLGMCMSTVKERFQSAYPLANYEAVYARLMRDNKDKFYEAIDYFQQGIAVEPFVTVKQVDKTYFDTNLTVEYICSNSLPNQFIGYDAEQDLFYVYSEELVFVYPTLESYVENLIERIINSPD